MGLNRFDEAKNVAEQAVAQKVDSLGVHMNLADIAYMHGDSTAYEHELGAIRANSGEPFMLFWKGLGQSGLGKIQATRSTWQQARSELLTSGGKDFAGTLLDFEAFYDVDVGYVDEARRVTSQALEVSQNLDVRANAAADFAAIGDGAKSAALLADLNRDFPDNFWVRSFIAPMAQAEQYMHKKQPAEAVAVLESVRPFELGVGPHGAGFYPNHLRGTAYLQLHDGTKAAAEFQHILDHRGGTVSDPLYALAHLNLGRAYVLQGDHAKARTAYQDFFAAWKDADPDLPILKEAKTEYQKLQ
jgi:tetratricopeptide (TPR) repeat protein